MAKIKSYEELIKAIQKEDWGVAFRTPYLSSGVSIAITVGVGDNAVTDFRHIYTNGRNEIVMDTSPGIVFAKTEYSDRYAEKMKALLDNVDKGALFRNMYDKSMGLLAEKLPIVYEFISSCDLQEDKSAGTLYATFDDLIGDYSIHYNPDFVVEMAISDCIINDDPVEILNGTFAFLLAHEAFHVLKYHIYNQTGATNDIEHELANILEDSFINTQLIDIFSKPGVSDSKKRKLSMGIGNDLKFSGEYNSIYKDTGSVADDIAQVFGAKSNRAKGGSIATGSRGSIRIYYRSDILQSIFNGNSNRFVRALSVISTKIIKNPKVSLDNLMDTLNSIMENSSGKGKSDTQEGSSDSGASGSSGASGGSNVSSGDSSGSQGGSSGSSGGSSVSSGDSGSKAGSSSGGSVDSINPLPDLLKDLANKISTGNSNKEESDKNMGSSPSATAKAKDKLNDSVREVEKNVKNGKGKSDSSESGDKQSKENALIDGLGISKGVINTSTVRSWKSSLSKVLRECLGSTENYNPNLPSARIRGQLGRDEDVSAPKAICLMVDQSGSMSVNKFSEALNEVEVFVKTARLRNVKVHLIMWGSSASYYKLPSTKDLVKNVKSKEAGLGGTDPNTFMDIIKQKCKRCDAYICFTDGQMNSDLSDENLLYFRKIKSRYIWVLTKSDYHKKWIERVDTGSKHRIIIPK